MTRKRPNPELLPAIPGSNAPVLIGLAEAAETLGVKKEWLQGWLRDHPKDVRGRAFGTRVGRAPFFNAGDLHNLKRHIDALKIVKAENKRSPRGKGHIYFIQQGDFIKIGWSSDWQYRIYHMQTSNPAPIVVLGVMEGTPQQERQTHRDFAAHRHQREWFFAVPEILEFVATRLASGLMVRP